MATEHGASRRRDEPTALPLTRLPSDVLSVILAALPLPFRIRAASRVCKLWRRVVLARVTSHTLHTAAVGSHLGDALALLPSLRHLDVRLSDQQVPVQVSFCLPTSLTSLRLKAREPSGNHRLSIEVPSCAALTSLDVRRIADTDAIVKLLSASAPLLRTLTLALEYEPSCVLAQALASLPLPSLTSLRLALHSAPLMRHFLSEYHTQLQHLKLTTDEGSLDYCLDTELRMELRLYSSLTALELCGIGWQCIYRSLPAFIASAPLLQTLTIPEEAMRETTVLTQLTALAAIDGMSVGITESEELAFLAASPRYALMLRSVCVYNSDANALRTVLQHCTALRKLRLYDVTQAILSAFPLAASLPLLTKVTVVGKPCLLAVLCALVSHLSAVCPNFEQLTLLSATEPTDALVSALIDACPKLAVLRLGVRRADFTAVTKAPAPRVHVVLWPVTYQHNGLAYREPY